VPAKWHSNTEVVVRPEEFEVYRGTVAPSVGVVALPGGITHIGQTRQWILERHVGDRVLMIDDDTVLSRPLLRAGVIRVRKSSNYMTTDEEFDDAMGMLDDIMDGGTPMTGFKAMVFPRPHDTGWYPTRKYCYTFTNVALDLSVIDPATLRLGDWPVLEDLYLFLELVSRGFRQEVITKYLVATLPPNAPGGCSEYRTTAMFNDMLLELKRRYDRGIILRDAKWSSLTSGDDATRIGFMCRVPKEWRQA